MKIIYSDVAIEVTRRCNMACAHCLRGDAMNIDQSEENIRAFLERTDGIGGITFTGGEPTLNVPIIRKTLEICRERNIPVDWFYIVTNGKAVNMDFLKVCIDWYGYICECNGELDLCGVALSRDQFHEEINGENLFKLMALSFFRERDKDVDFSRPNTLLGLGRALSLAGYEPRKADRADPVVEMGKDENGSATAYVGEATITLTSTGHILPDCDYSYDEESQICLGHVSNMTAYEQELVSISEEE